MHEIHWQQDMTVNCGGDSARGITEETGRVLVREPGGRKGVLKAFLQLLLWLNMFLCFVTKDDFLYIPFDRLTPRWKAVAMVEQDLIVQTNKEIKLKMPLAAPWGVGSKMRMILVKGCSWWNATETFMLASGVGFALGILSIHSWLAKYWLPTSPTLVWLGEGKWSLSFKECGTPCTFKDLVSQSDF